MKVRFKKFRGYVKSWDVLFKEAAEFATGVGQDNVISISHSDASGDGVVTVWYWG